MWAANNQDYYAGYHGYRNCGIFVVAFSNGNAHMKSDEEHNHDEHKDRPS